MSVKSVRPVCAESNPVHSDPGTSARDRFAVNSSAGLSFSPSPEWLWSRITQGCFPASTESKVRVLAGNLSALDEIHNESHDGPLGGKVSGPERIHDADSREAYAEHMDNHSQSVAAMANLRETVKSLSPDELQITAEQFAALKLFLYHRINDLAPYYTQMGNLNILQGEGHRAWRRTCNVTSLSMALEGLGIGPANFGGNTVLLERIAAALEPWRAQQEGLEDQRVAKLGAAALAAAAAKAKHPKERYSAGPEKIASEHDWGQCYSSLGGLRMPDFVQLVAVYTVFTDPSVVGKKQRPGRLAPEKAFLEDVLAARNLAPGLVLSTTMLVRLARQFGVAAHDTSVAVGAYAREIQSYGTVNRDLDDWKGKEKSFKQNLGKGKKELDENDSGYQDIKRHEKEDEDKLEGLKGDWDKNVAAYRAQVLREVLPKTDDGAQVIVNKPGHFMKLHSIEPSGLRMDDPWTPGKRHLVSWSDAYKQGYFRSYIVLTT
jgi:hypothetical protein